MAKKKSDRDHPSPNPRGLMSFWVSHEFRAWIQDFANARKARMVDLIVEGLAMLARHYKFRKPPER